VGREWAASDEENDEPKYASHDFAKRWNALAAGLILELIGARRCEEMGTKMAWNEDEVRGKIDETAGKVKERIGRANNDPILEEEGSDQRSAHGVQHGVGKARRKAGDAIKDVGNKVGGSAGAVCRPRTQRWRGS